MASRTRCKSAHGRVMSAYVPSPIPRCTTASPRITTPLSTSYLLNDQYRPNGKPLGRSRELAHAKTYFNPARNVLYSRYSPSEWTQSNHANFAVSEKEKCSSERFRADALRAIHDIDARTRNRQAEATRKLGERMQEIQSWKSELNAEINAMQTETANLKEFKRVLEKAYMDTANPLHVAEECLMAREKRQGIDQVHDDVEKSLVKEVNAIKNCQEHMKRLLQKSSVQLKLNRAAQDACERDSRDKHQAQYTDDKMNQLRNTSAGIGFYPGVEGVDQTISIPESWQKFSRDNILRSQNERAASERLRSEIENHLRACANDLWTNFNNVNNQLKARVQETQNARNKLQSKLSQTMQEVYDLNKQIEMLRKALLDLEPPLKVSQTRLQERTTRPNVEDCHDFAMSTLQREVHEIKESMRLLREKLKLAQSAMARLMRNKSMLEADIAVKENSLAIDQKMCLGMRKSMPTDSKVGPIFQMPLGM